MMLKKGSLNLSIEAIVIVVIAFVVLGLGLGFVRGQFKQMTETSGSVQEQIKQQILDDLRTGNKKLSFPSSELKIEAASSSVMAVGIKNTGDSTLKFKIELEDLSNTCSSSGVAAIKSSTQPGDYCAAFYWNSQEQSLNAGDSNVYNIKYFAPSKKGSYLYKIKVTDTVKNGEFSSKSFFASIS